MSNNKWEKVTEKGTVLPLINLKGKQYLEVKYRLVWFRERYPLWSIETEIKDIDLKSCVCKATIKEESGRIIATAHKYENQAGFGDFREKAETGSVGRALALIGFGTQFEPEFEEGERIVDAPIVLDLGIHPKQPENGDGNIGHNGYRIPFGKFKSRSLEEVGPNDLRSYVEYLEGKAKKDGQTIDPKGAVGDFIIRVEEYVGSFENNT